jgi:hypothetical protein
MTETQILIGGFLVLALMTCAIAGLGFYMNRCEN